MNGGPLPYLHHHEPFTYFVLHVFTKVWDLRLTSTPGVYARIEWILYLQHHKRLIFWEDKLLWIGNKYRCLKNKGFWLRGFQNFLYYLNKFWNLSNGTLGNASSINNATFVDFHCVSSGEATDLKKLFLFMLLFC